MMPHVMDRLHERNQGRIGDASPGMFACNYEQDMAGEITEVSFLGGLLHGYRRERMAA